MPQGISPLPDMPVIGAHILPINLTICSILSHPQENNPEEANLHYAELQNLPGSSRGQCDGGPCASASAVQNSDYATVAELQGTMGAGCSEPMEDEGVGDEVKESQPCVEVE